MRFIDLFAGLGGFHLALQEQHKCVFASEIDETLRDLYESNFGLRPAGDIREVPLDAIPEHDILCAGFPCQPFSKAGAQHGFADPLSGSLYKEIVRIIRARRPSFVILENVPNFENHDEGRSWGTVEGALKGLGYNVEIRKYSPHHFGIPQVRPRIYILATQGSLNGVTWPIADGQEPNIRTVLKQNPGDARQLPDQVERALDVWQDFLGRVPPDQKIPHPLWSMEFGATYPYDDLTPHATSLRELRGFRGAFGVALGDAAEKADALALLPSHGRTRQRRFPGWKIEFIKKNREFYLRNKHWIDEWLPSIRTFPSSFQKLEWNCQERDPREEIRDLSQYVIQIRASGVRVKRPTTAPSLIAMTATQVPIIGWERRYMTIEECQKLQSMDALRMPESTARAYAALGNAVNVDVVRRIADAFIRTETLDSSVSDAEAAPDEVIQISA